MALDVDSKKYLEEVKRGKPRKFVMICKGVKILSMVIYKKGAVEKYKKQAKEEGKGQVYYGVVSGKGMNITFNLLRSDGFEKPPGKELILKDFLKTEADLKFKPTYEIVDELPAVPFEDEDLQDPLIARFMKMEAVINKACDAHPESIPEIETKVKHINNLLQDEETRESAGPQMDQFVKYLKDLLASNAAASPSPPETAEPNDPSAAAKTDSATPADQDPAGQDPADQAAARKTKLAEALKKLKPLVDKVINTDPNRKGELHATMAQIAGEIKQNKLDEAKQNITDFATMLKSLVAQQSTVSASESVDLSIAYAERRNALEPRLLEAQRADREKAAKLGAVWDVANDQAEADNYATAMKTLERLETAIDSILAAPAKSDAERFGIEKGIVEKRKFLVTRFKEIPMEIKPHLEAVKKKIIDEDADEAPEELAKAIEAELQTLYDELQSEIDDSINAGDSSRIAGLKARVTSHEMVQHLLNNPFTDGTKFQSTILAALDEIEQKLAG